MMSWLCYIFVVILLLYLIFVFVMCFGMVFVVLLCYYVMWYALLFVDEVSFSLFLFYLNFKCCLSWTGTI